MIHHGSHSKPIFVRLSSDPVLPIRGLPTSCGINNCVSIRIAGPITERTTRYKENEENETTTTTEQSGERGKGGGRMKKRIRGMTSASRGEKERKRGWDVDAVEREWQNGASEKRASHRRCGARRHGEKRRRTKKAVGRFARVATLSCERREETGYMTMKREKRSTGRSVE